MEDLVGQVGFFICKSKTQNMDFYILILVTPYDIIGYQNTMRMWLISLTCQVLFRMQEEII